MLSLLFSFLKISLVSFSPLPSNQQHFQITQGPVGTAVDIPAKILVGKARQKVVLNVEIR